MFCIPGNQPKYGIKFFVISLEIYALKSHLSRGRGTLLSKTCDLHLSATITSMVPQGQHGGHFQGCLEEMQHAQTLSVRESKSKGVISN